MVVTQLDSCVTKPYPQHEGGRSAKKVVKSMSKVCLKSVEIRALLFYLFDFVGVHHGQHPSPGS